ncbi:MAG TPA: hypothetical protein VFI24_23510 [Pyrinomonadaceae bacterium]|nr:hypothetical protein [Pyrinomonadaceae bacterium]
MPNTENTKQANQENSFRKSIRKAPGTRVGTIQDWRAANGNSAKPLGRHGASVRDGR